MASRGLMFNNKNLSPKRLSLITALVIAAPIGLAFFAITKDLLKGAISLVLVFIFCNIIFSYILKKYFDEKIKLIYRFISQTKASKREELFNKELLPQKSLAEVTEDVEKWAIQRNSEIELLQQNEVFRKEFLQNLSHELRTPTFAIQGYLESLIDGGIENRELAEKFLASAHRNVERLSNLINDLSDITGLEIGTLTLNYSIFSIQELVLEVVQELHLNMKEKNIEFNIKKGTEGTFTVYADRSKIKQVITNLVVNGIKYGKQNGLITGGFYSVDGKNVLVEITDNGIGIAEQYLVRIFERFYRTDAARSRREGGSGLGLAICKHIIEAHNHMLQVRSKLDLGSTFGFTLSLHDK